MSNFNHEGSVLQHVNIEWDADAPYQQAFGQLGIAHPDLCATVKKNLCLYVHALHKAAGGTNRFLSQRGIDIFELERQAALPTTVISAKVVANIVTAFWKGFEKYRAKFRGAGGLSTDCLTFAAYYMLALEFIWPVLYPRAMMAIDIPIQKEVSTIKLAVFETKGARWYRNTDFEIEVVGAPPPWQQGVRCDVNLRHYLCNVVQQHMSDNLVSIRAVLPPTETRADDQVQQSAGQSVNQSAGQPVNQSAGQPVQQSVDHTDTVLGPDNGDAAPGYNAA